MGEWLWWLVLAMNVFTFLLFGWDKWKASRGGWRVPEAQLAMASALTGCVGGWLAMSVFRHKTRKRSFQLKMLLATLVNGLWLYWWWRSRAG